MSRLLAEVTANASREPGSHAAVLQGGDRWGWSLRCDCGRRFNAYRHLIERDVFESPTWEAHAVGSRPSPAIPNSDGLE